MEQGRRNIVTVDLAEDRLLSRAAHELSLKADQLIHDVERRLRHEVPELWDEPDLARMAAENTTERIGGVLFALEHGIEPSRIAPPAIDVERARRLAQLGKPVSAMLRAFRLAQGLVLDRMLEELSLLTNDAELIGAATRRLVALGTEYVDHTSERSVEAFQDERDRRLQWRLSVVNEAGMSVGTTLDIGRTTQELADLAVERFADVATVDLLDSAFTASGDPVTGTSVVRRVAQRPEPEQVQGDTGRENLPETAIAPQQLHSYPEQSPPALALVTGRPSRHHRVGPPVPGSPPAHPDDQRFDGAPQIHSTMVVPLRARGATLGVAQFARNRNPDPYDDEDLFLAQEIAARAAVAVDNARRYTHARAAAIALQRSLLPQHTPAQSAVDVACRYLPAGSDVGVGGDWYDVIPLSGARVALVVGDVVGHGVPAAATMGRLRTAVRTLADIDLPPDELLTHLDDVVERLSVEASTDPEAQSSGDIGATCLYAVYDPVTGCCAMARAGHVLPALVTPGGAAETLDLPAGPPLGLGGLPFEAAEFDLPEGSLLALYTDGLIEAPGHDVETGLTRLRSVLARHTPSLESACDAVLEALLPVGRPEDDVALLLARTRTLGAHQVVTWDLEADPASVAGARARVTEHLGVWGLEDLVFTAELVVSELVTNAIRYGRPPVRLRLIHDRTLMCEVSDGSSTTPHLRRARFFEEGGRGLLLVAQLAERWGTRHQREGKTVWAELTEKSADVPLLDFPAL